MHAGKGHAEAENPDETVEVALGKVASLEVGEHAIEDRPRRRRLRMLIEDAPGIFGCDVDSAMEGVEHRGAVAGEKVAGCVQSSYGNADAPADLDGNDRQCDRDPEAAVDHRSRNELTGSS